MYYLSYTEAEYASGEGKLKQRMVEFDNLEAVRKRVASFSGSKQNTNILILTNVENQIDYQAKFEELYNHLLMSSGIRKNSGLEKSNEAVIVHEPQN